MEGNNNQESILVSVIVPIYNTEKYLPRCIESICKQTYKNIEIILVNDGSEDKSLEIAKEFAKKDNRIIVLNQKNSGPVIARKNGIRRASGDYVIIEDSDDWLESDLVKKCVEVTKTEENVDIVKFGYICEPSKKEKNILNERLVTERVVVGERIDQIIKLLIYSVECNSVWNEMVKRQLYDFDDKIFDNAVRQGDDLQINLHIFLKAKKIVFLEDNLYHYVDNPDGATNNISAKRIISNIRESIFINGVRKRIAIERFGCVDEEKLINMTLSALSGRIIAVLANSITPKDDLIEIQEGLRVVLPAYLVGFDSSSIRQNMIKKAICKNILNGDYLKNLRYRPICKILKMVGVIK